jgi:hypothetical protein
MSQRLTDRLRDRTLLLFYALTLVAVASCGKSTKPPPAGSSTYTGTVTGETITGTLTLTVATANPSPGLGIDTRFNASGTFTPNGGAAVALSGSYYDTGGFDHTFAVEGAAPGKFWQFGGTLTSWGGFRGIGSDTLSVTDETAFVTLLKGGTSDVTMVQGSYASTPPAVNGLFNFVFDGSGQVRGDAVLTGTAAHSELDGTYASGTHLITITGTPNPASPPGPAAPVATATGNYTAPNASGTYTDGSGGNGTWTGVKTP